MSSANVSILEDLVTLYQTNFNVDYERYINDPQYRLDMLSEVDSSTISPSPSFFDRPQFKKFYIETTRSKIFETYEDLTTVGQTCGKCGSTRTVAYVGPSTRSGDEAKTEGYTCRTCGHAPK